MKHWMLLLILMAMTGLVGRDAASANTAEAAFRFDGQPFDIGNPTLRDLHVDPVRGDDRIGDGSAAAPWRTLTRAWESLPVGEPLTEGVRILLGDGVYTPDMTPNYWESRYGTYNAPIVITAAAGAESVRLPSVNIFDSHFVYFIGLTFESDFDPFHCERCTYLLLRDVVLRGADPETYATQETLKVNQSQYVFIENSTIGGAWDNAFDMVAVQYGHLIDSTLHDAGDWCGYVKGGSAYWRIERNIFTRCGTGGFTVGQGTGYEFMVAPWIHYEAYGVVVAHNTVESVEGAAFGVNGGYNVTVAYNTAREVGARSHVLEVGHGLRSCDGDAEACEAFCDLGGWGAVVVGTEERTPSANVALVNNRIVNTSPSQWQHFFISAPHTPTDGLNIPNPATVTDGLVIAGNVIVNGGAGMALGCEPPVCDPDQLRRDNALDGGETVAEAALPPWVWGAFPPVPSLDDLQPEVPAPR
jgi:hypothetical protein